MITSIVRRDGQWTVTVNGTDLTSEITRIEFTADPDQPYGPPRVTLHMRPSDLTVEADDAEVVNVPHEHTWVSMVELCGDGGQEVCSDCNARREVRREVTDG